MNEFDCIYLHSIECLQVQMLSTNAQLLAGLMKLEMNRYVIRTTPGNRRLKMNALRKIMETYIKDEKNS